MGGKLIARIAIIRGQQFSPGKCSTWSTALLTSAARALMDFPDLPETERTSGDPPAVRLVAEAYKSR